MDFTQQVAYLNSQISAGTVTAHGKPFRPIPHPNHPDRETQLIVFKLGNREIKELLRIFAHPISGEPIKTTKEDLDPYVSRLEEVILVWGDEE